GIALGSQQITLDGTNKSVIFKFSPQQALTGLRNSVISFAADGSWWATEGAVGLNKKLAQWAPMSTGAWRYITTADFNGDGKDDLVGRIQRTGDWIAGLSTGTSLNNVNWGRWSPSVAWADVQLGDLNGDGKADLIGRVPATGQWYAGLSSGAGQTIRLFAT